jgi:NADPH:quinone reductase-like Zn-dependent oxidoreductase
LGTCARKRRIASRYLAEPAQAGAFKPVIDRRYPFAQIVVAHRYVETDRKKVS